MDGNMLRCRLTLRVVFTSALVAATSHAQEPLSFVDGCFIGRQQIRCSGRRVAGATISTFAKSAVPEFYGDNISVDDATVGVPFGPRFTCFTCKFAGQTEFSGFKQSAYLFATQFTGKSSFSGEFQGSFTLISSEVAQAVFDRVIFDGVFRCDSQLQGVTFENTRFKEDADFLAAHLRYVTFDGQATSEISQSGIRYEDIAAAFDKKASFVDADLQAVTFDTVKLANLDLSHSTLTNVTFRSCTLAKMPNLENVTVRKALSFAHSELQGGLDLRFTTFAPDATLCLDNVNVSPATLYIDWRSLQASRSSRIVTQKTADVHADFERLAATYELIIRSFEARGDKYSADDARAELEQRRQEYLGGVWHGAYGVLLGYGYKPWRVVYAVAALICIFALVYWRWRFVIGGILNERVRSDGAHVTRIAYIAYVLVFSGAVLLGIRYQREWIAPGRSGFVVLVTIEWAIGLAMYVLFIAFVRTVGFAYVKGLLGF